MKTAITLTLGDIGVIIVISMLAAVAVQAWFLARTKAQAGATFKPGFAAPQSAFADVPQEHVAAIAAAVAAMLGVHRIVRIETPDRGYSWTAEARTVHHTSHVTR